MTPKQRKERKVKLLGLIVLCEWLILMKDPPKTIQEAIIKGEAFRYWWIQLNIVQSQPIPKVNGTFDKGSLAIVNDSNKPEIIIKR